MLRTGFLTKLNHCLPSSCPWLGAEASMGTLTPLSLLYYLGAQWDTGQIYFMFLCLQHSSVVSQ